MRRSGDASQRAPSSYDGFSIHGCSTSSGADKRGRFRSLLVVLGAQPGRRTPACVPATADQQRDRTSLLRLRTGAQRAVNTEGLGHLAPPTSWPGCYVRRPFPRQRSNQRATCNAHRTLGADHCDSPGNPRTTAVRHGSRLRSRGKRKDLSRTPVSSVSGGGGNGSAHRYPRQRRVTASTK